MSDADPQKPEPKAVKPTVLGPGQGGPKPRTASGVDRTDIPADAGPRVRKGWDIALSIVLMFLGIGAYLTGSVIALLGIAFFGSCNAGDCSGDTVTTTALVLLVVTIVGIAATIGALILRFRGWWIAAVVLGTVIIGWIVSYALSAFGA